MTLVAAADTDTLNQVWTHRDVTHWFVDYCFDASGGVFKARSDHIWMRGQSWERYPDWI